jgi:C-terminal processing protease CtpA/Prc
VVERSGAAGGAAGGAQPAGAGGAAATYRVQIHRTQAGLGIILQTTHDGDPIVEVAQGAAAQAGVVAGSVVLSCCGKTVQGHGEGAVVAVIKGLPPQAPVELVLQRPALNWNTTIRRR